MNDNEFLVKIWTIVGICFCVLVLTLGGCEGYLQARVISSPDPIAAACARGGSDKNITCVAVAARR